MLGLISKLKPAAISIDRILLDPNNPRFLGKKFSGKLKSSGPVSESRFAVDTVQQAALNKMLDEDFDVKSIRDSIRENGFLPLDQIVVRPIGEYFVVVEGNRRVAAIKSLLQQNADGEIEINEEEEKSLSTLKVLVLQSSPDDIQNDQWLLQGIRHLSGVKEWGPYQKASLISKMFDQGKNARQIADSLGMTVVMVNRFYRTLKAIEQMQGYEEYSEYAGPELFTHFEEAYRIPKIRDYLGWSEAESSFLNEEKLLEFYKWMIPTEELNNERKLKRGKDVDYLAEIIENPAALSAMRDPKCDLNEVLLKLGGEQEFDWKNAVEESLKSLQKIPIGKMESFDEEDFNLLEKLIKEASKRVQQARDLRG